MINAIISWCLRNRLLVLMAVAGSLGLGYYALRYTPVDALPDVGEKQVIVYADWPGRDPKVVEDQVTFPLTVGLQGTPGVKSIRSMSGFGFSMVFVIFHDHVDYYWARSRVLERMNVATQKLPKEVVPVLGPDATALGQIFWYTLEAEGADLAQLRSLQDWYVRYQLQAVEGVSEVASIGGFVKQYQIDIHPDKLRAHRVALPEVYEAVRRSNIDVGAKVVEQNGLEFFIRGAGFVKTVSDIENIVIRQEAGTPIYVKNVGTVQLGPEFRRGVLDNAGTEAVGGIVLMRFGENPLAVIERIKDRIAEIEPGLRIVRADGKQSAVRIVAYYDRSDIIYETMGTLREALLEEGLVVAVIVLLFLLHVRSSLAIVPLLPLSVLASFVLMYWLGVDGNIMSLAGLAIAIGDVADMGIIMTENIYRRLSEEPDRPYFDVISDAAKEVGGPMFAAVTNTVISFIPVFALTEAEGKMFRPLAYTKTFAIGASMVLGITVVPVLCYYLFKPVRLSRFRALMWALFIGFLATEFMYYALRWGLGPDGTWSGWPTAIGIGVMVAAAVYRAGRERIVTIEDNAVSRGIHAVFRPALRWTLNNKAAFLVMPAVLVIVGLLVWLGFGTIAYPIERGLEAVGVEVGKTTAWTEMKRIFPGIGREFMPPLDEGSLLYMPSLLPSASLTQGQEVLAKQNRAIREVPEVEHVVGKIGRSESALDPAPTSMIETIITLKPESQWRKVRQERWHSGKSWLGWADAFWPEERRMTKAELLAELQEKTAIPGVLPTWLQPIQTRLVMLQTGFRAMMGVKIFGSDPQEIEKIALQMEKILRDVRGATDVVADRIIGRPYVQFEPNREVIARYGVNIRDVQDIIEIGIGGENITTTVEGRERYPIRVRYPRELRERFDDLERILVPTSTGAHVPIGMLGKVNYIIGPQELKSENGLLVGYVTLNTRERDEISVVEDAEMKLQSAKLDGTLQVPPGYYWQWSGQFENQRRAMARLAWMVPVVLFSMFVMIYIGLGKWWLAFIVFAGIVVSASGGFALLTFWGSNLSVAVWVGFIALFGVADDVSVVMLSFLEGKFQGKQPKSITEIRELVMEAALARVRPLLMTTATTVIGLMPIFLTSGRGSDVMQPMAIPSVGGMAVQVITFLLAPCLYCLVMEWQFSRAVRAGTIKVAPQPEAGHQ